MAENWVETDEAEDVAGSVRHALRTRAFVSDDPQAWKWVALALHSALQGACVCHLTTTAAPVGAVTHGNAAEWLAYLQARRTDPKAKRPDTKLSSLPNLLKTAKDFNDADDEKISAGITLSDSELAWLGRFHDEIRNRFVHFEPMGWSLEISGIPELAKLIARIIEEIVDAGWAFHHKDIGWQEDLRQNLQHLAANDSPAHRADLVQHALPRP